ncbi:peroxidase family protein [Ornithinimicrobium avium]|uniref:peroxidase family protein n=1 Tax=Ornithinimicrobium avium TaxID=2283195 RepID=UPI0013B3B6E0|nr:peroxidase family protein [Ornithinimicrobium avium]
MRTPVSLFAAAAVVLTTAAAGSAGAAPSTAPTTDFAPLATDEDPSFGLIPSDLEFILDQIEISEAHAYAIERQDRSYSLLCRSNQDTSGKCVRDPMLPHGLRTVDGSFNNLEFDTTIGKSNELMPRLLPIRWRQGETPMPMGPTAGDTSMCEDPNGTCYEQYDGLVYDTQPRVITNLIVDNTTNNPTVQVAADNNPDAVIDPDTGELYLPNTTADEALSPPVNMWFVFFGQFFDHGLDLVDKHPENAIIVPLSPDDPLWSRTDDDKKFLAMSRATNQPGPDGVDSTSDDVREHQNRTTPWVDQNQTYTSHPAHQVFIREYELVGTPARPVATGRLLNGPNGGLATWDAVQEQALTVLGIDLRDQSVLNVPQVVVDPYGQFIPGPAGFPQLLTPGGAVEGNLTTPVVSTDAVPLPQSFLDDIAHGATPAPPVDDPECDTGECPTIPGYDNVLLGEHFITGDGRGNENIGLSAVHHVFHSEHNRLAAHVQDILDANPDLKARFESSGEADDWTYAERVFQAARFTNEMQYQHLVFEEFARIVQPAIDAVVFNENAYDSTIDASIKAEFAHVVYRFGHSMLTETIARDLTRADGAEVTDARLLDGFLNPRQYHCAVAPDANNVCPADAILDPEEAAGAIVNGTTDQVANQVDELVTSTLRNNLLGLPLDLATINILRARDTGVPGLQQARRTFYAQSGNPQLEPYSSWVDFGLNLKNGQNFGRGASTTSLVNFVAAYGQHPSVLEATTLSGKRAAASALVNGIGTVDIVQRIAGDDRYETAAAVSRAFFPTAQTVYIANGTVFPDALTGGPAAAADGGPVLPVRQNAIPVATVQEIIRLRPQKIVLLGGTSAVSEQVANSLETYAPVVERRGGDNRYHTGTLVTRSAFPDPAAVDTVYVASGQAYPDALSGSAAAAAEGAPLLLSRPGSVPDEVLAEITRLAPSSIVLLGGETALSPAVATQLGALATVTRIGGSDRYETSAMVSRSFAAVGGSAFLAAGTNFPDALAGAAAAGMQQAPVMLVRSGSLPTPVQDELVRLAPNKVYVLGGETVLTPALVTAVQALFPAPTAPADRGAFMASTGDWANVDGRSITGLEDVDFWVGGLAEALDPFGGMLGSTFNYVFEQQLEDLQFGDRFYYLFRNQGNQLFAALEANSFSKLIQRNTDASLLPADIFLSHSPYFDLENLPDPLPSGLSQMADGTWRWDGDEHVEIHGDRTLGDRIRGGQGDDSLWGYGGNDRIEGGSGDDSIQGGPGDDILTDSFGNDNIKGGHGNDAIDGGPGADLLFGQSGDDFIAKPSDNSDGATGFFGTGDDVFIGGTGRDNPFGNEGDDWLEGGLHADLLMGDNGQQFQDDVDGGDDVLIGGGGSDDHDAEGGDDIMVGQAGGTDRYHGMFGFDYVTYDGTGTNVDADLNFNLLQPPDVTAIRDRYLQVESLSGGSGDDVIRGLGVAPDDLSADAVNRMDPENLDLVDGMRELLNPAGHEQDYSMRLRSDNPLLQDTDGVANLLFGGAGDDILEGRFGDDVIDGDRALRVRLVHTTTGQRYASAADMRAAVFSGAINPGDIDIVRELVDESDAGDVDTAVYTDAFINDVGDPNYTIKALPDGYWEVVHIGGAEFEESEGADILVNIEMLQFGDGGCFELNEEMTPCTNMGYVSFGGQTEPPTEDQPITATVHLLDPDGNATVTDPVGLRFSWQAGEATEAWDPSPTEGGEVTPGPDPNTWQQEFVPGDGDAGAILRVVVTFEDDNGQLRQIVSPVVGNGASVVNINDSPTGLTLSTTTPQVGQSILPSPFVDADGLEEAVAAGMTYSWQTSGDGFAADVVTVATKVTPDTNQLGYTVQPADEGRQIRVVVDYTDDQGTAETYASDPTDPVAPAVPAGP